MADCRGLQGVTRVGTVPSRKVGAYSPPKLDDKRERSALDDLPPFKEPPGASAAIESKQARDAEDERRAAGMSKTGGNPVDSRGFYNPSDRHKGIYQVPTAFDANNLAALKQHVLELEARDQNMQRDMRAMMRRVESMDEKEVSPKAVS